jgi:hypothetical protein
VQSVVVVVVVVVVVATNRTNSKSFFNKNEKKPTEIKSTPMRDHQKERSNSNDSH